MKKLPSGEEQQPLDSLLAKGWRWFSLEFLYGWGGGFLLGFLKAFLAVLLF